MGKITRTIFIASSSEDTGLAMSVVKAINKCDRPDLTFHLLPVHWQNTEFELNKNNLQSLIKFPQKYDYGCFIFTPNDTVISRDVVTKRVRDNVVFEFGLFVSQEDGLKKAYILHPKDGDIKLASDLQGVVTAEYNNSTHAEVLEGNIQLAVEKIFKTIIEYEKQKMKESEYAVEMSISNLKEKLKIASEVNQPEIILNALKDLAITKGRALNQSASEVLKDILTWVNTLVDILDIDELAKLQNTNLKYVWVYSSMPLEFDKKLVKLSKKFIDIVKTNISSGVRYTYFIDSELLLPKIKNIYSEVAETIEVYVLDAHCVTSNYVFHFYNDQSYDVYQNIVRKGELESLIKLDNEDAFVLQKKIKSQLIFFDSKNEDGILVHRKKV